MPSLPTLLLLVYSKGNPTIPFYLRLFTYHMVKQISFTIVIHWNGTPSIERVKFGGRVFLSCKGYQ